MGGGYEGLGSVHIVGCGLVGSNLAVKLCFQKICKKLYLYDDDMVSEDNKEYFPFIHCKENNYKTLFIKNLINNLKLVNSLRIFTQQKKINKKIKIYKKNDIVIDCRDCKKVDIRPTIRCSMDGSLLMIDCREATNYKNTITNYVLQRELKYINLGIAMIFRYLMDEEYKKKELVYYDLQNLSTSNIQLL
tara:strand:+ start:1150 stop:1719 length:570 start_codon:yes stop_codon:yes gene_type:complete